MRFAFMAASAALLAGCTLGEAPKPTAPTAPLPTDGAGQVVVKVSGMV